MPIVSCAFLRNDNGATETRANRPSCREWRQRGIGFDERADRRVFPGLLDERLLVVWIAQEAHVEEQIDIGRHTNT